MIPPVLNDTGDCCCQCPPNGQDGWCHCNDDYNGKGDDIENAITCDLVWTEIQANGKKKYFKVVSGSAQQNMPVVLPTATLKKRGVVQLTNDLSNREDLALTPKGAKDLKTQLDKETADRINADNNLQSQIDKEKTVRANADKDLSDRITQETADRKTADNVLSSSITNVSNRVTTVESKVNNSVTSVTSNGDATVTVTKTDGTSSNFTINNVAHASSADSATNADNATHATNADNATHATNADTATKATNADHATVADRLADGSVGLGFPDYSKGVDLIFKDALHGPSSQTMTSNGFVIASCSASSSAQSPSDAVSAKISFTVNGKIITVQQSTANNGASADASATLCFPVKKGDTVFITAIETHTVGNDTQGKVFATFFPCL